jgi:signal transduction histidine kinase/CheY-like chemotaxis protein
MRFVRWRGLSDAYRVGVEGHSPWRRDSPNPAPILIEDVESDPSVAALREILLTEGIRSLIFVPLKDKNRLLGKFMAYFDVPRKFTPEEGWLAETIAQHVGFGLGRLDAEAMIMSALERERAARAAADEASRAKDEFLAMLSHELRNPLGAIMHAGSLLQAESARAGDLHLPLSVIERQSSHLARLLDDLLDVSRITGGHIEIEKHPLDLKEVVSAVRLQQVVANLISNASKYTPVGGDISVVLESADAEALLRVRDTGVGIPPGRVEAMFGLFVQANPTLARSEGGLGVGLTLARRLVELHGGIVTGHSEGPGKGAEFTVRLPLAPSAEVRKRPEPEASPRLSAKRILVIEDHADARMALTMLLRLEGHQVAEASTGSEGIALIQEYVPEVVLVDIGLPDLDGYEVARSLRAALGKSVQIVALSGYVQPADRERARAAGFDAHLAKPVEAATLREVFQALVR